MVIRPVNKFPNGLLNGVLGKLVKYQPPSLHPRPRPFARDQDKVLGTGKSQSHLQDLVENQLNHCFMRFYRFPWLDQQLKGVSQPGNYLLGTINHPMMAVCSRLPLDVFHTFNAFKIRILRPEGRIIGARGRQNEAVRHCDLQICGKPGGLQCDWHG